MECRAHHSPRHWKVEKSTQRGRLFRSRFHGYREPAECSIRRRNRDRWRFWGLEPEIFTFDSRYAV